MKYILLISILLSGLIQAKEYKAVFDCSSADAYYIKTRMALIGKTIKMIEEKGDKTKIAVTLHGNCVAMVSENFHEIIDDNDLGDIQSAQDSLKSLYEDQNVEVVVCAMSLEGNAISHKEVLPFIKIVPNSFIDTIGYQNDGYALMTFK